MARQSNSLKLLHIMAQERETRQRQREIARAETKRLAYNCRLSRANLQTALTASYLYGEGDAHFNPWVLSIRGTCQGDRGNPCHG